MSLLNVVSSTLVVIQLWLTLRAVKEEKGEKIAMGRGHTIGTWDDVVTSMVFEILRTLEGKPLVDDIEMGL